MVVLPFLATFIEPNNSTHTFMAQVIFSKRLFLLGAIFYATWFRPCAAQEGVPFTAADFSYLYYGGAQYDSNPKAAPGSWETWQRVVYAHNDSMAVLMAKSIVRAMNERWGCNLQDVVFKVDRADKLFRETPKKLKPKTKNLDPNFMHVFMHITDLGKNGSALTGINPIGATNPNLATRLQFECKVISGKDRKETFSREMNLDMVHKEALPGQYMLYKLPCLPCAFMQAFDSAVSRFFGNAAPLLMNYEVEPAYLYVTDSVAHQIRRLVKFERNEATIELLGQPSFKWTINRDKTEKMGRVSKLVGNSMKLLFTALTGVESSQVSLVRYRTTVSMTDATQPDPYVYVITFLEEERTEVSKQGTRSNYNLVEGGSSVSRYMDPEQNSLLLLGPDTIGEFKFKYGRKEGLKENFTHYWNGQDSATITPLPSNWTNTGLYKELHVDGTLYGKPFTLQNSKENSQLDVYYDGMHIATLRVLGDVPRDGMVYYADVEEKVLKALTTFTSLPFSFFY
jgi:hypothetical protein